MDYFIVAEISDEWWVLKQVDDGEYGIRDPYYTPFAKTGKDREGAKEVAETMNDAEHERRKHNDY